MTDSRVRSYWLEWLILLAVVYLYSHAATLDFDPQQMQQTGEQNESATLPILAELGFRHGEIPLWNPYMLTGFPHTGDPVSHFWNPVATLPVLLWGGINGMKVSLFLSLLVAAFGQWYLAHVFGLRGVFRLWAGLLFVLSGGLAMLSWLGWYELLVGAAWFPWCFALLWRALRRGGRLSVVLAAGAIAMVITTGGGYYPLYLGVCLAVLTGMALVWSRLGEHGRVLRRAAAVAVLAAGLSAVYWLPLVDGLRYTVRDAPPDGMQIGSQAIPYALFNFVVSDPTWFRAEVLNKGSGSGWLYVGLLPIVALGLLPWVYAHFRGRRRGLLTLLALLLTLLLWNANRYAPVRTLYDLLPFLYTFRFPGRLLIIATSPLLVLAGMGLQTLLVRARRRVPARAEAGGITPRWLMGVAAALLLLLSVINVFRVNQPFMTAPHPRNQVARAALTWLREADPGLYYINIGGDIIYWDWLAYAYELELPVLNFRYNRGLDSMDAQYGPLSPFNAQPKYTFVVASEPPPPGATQVNLFAEVAVWRRDDVLPYAFAARPDAPITTDTVRAVDVRLDGPNRVVVQAAAEADETQLVVLVSDYPGWRLTVDGAPAELQPLNGYLGAALRPGAHTYVFAFRPPLHAVALAVSGLSLLACLALLAPALRRPKV
ncbi:MAG TPA: hypothetical protein PK829_10555 [Promineifilum sp.]|nr:hypothetical protein [Promineifilum sp.]